MSTIATRQVWANSKQDGSKLILLLAIADFADDSGVASLPIEGLAAKARVGARQARRLIEQIEQDGEIAVQRGVGRGQASIYAINLPQMSPFSEQEKVTSRAKGDTAMSPFSEQEKVTSRAKKVTSRAKGDTAMSPFSEESETENEEPVYIVTTTNVVVVKDNNNNNCDSSSSSPAPTALEVTEPLRPEPQQPALPATFAPAVSAIDPADWARVRAVYESDFGLFTSLLVERVQDALRQHPAEMVILAMGRAVSANRRRWDYVEGILRNWSVEGYGNAGAKNAPVGAATESRGAGRSGGAGGANSAGRQEAPAPEGLREWLIATGQVPVIQAAD